MASDTYVVVSIVLLYPMQAEGAARAEPAGRSEKDLGYRLGRKTRFNTL